SGASFEGEELLGDSYSLQCGSFPESFFVSDAVKVQINKTANRVIWTIYSVSSSVARVVFATDFFKEFAVRRMFNPNVSKIHFIIARDQVGNIVPVLNAGEEVLHDLVEAAICDHNEEVQQRADLDDAQKKAHLLAPHDRTNPFYSYSVIDNAGAATTKEHWKRITFSHVKRRTIKVIETTSNLSIVGMGFWKWVKRSAKRVESTESMRTSEHAQGTLLYDQVLGQYDYFFYYKQAEGLLLPHTASSIKPPESTEAQKKLDSQALGRLSKMKAQEKQEQAEARSRRLPHTSFTSTRPPPSPSSLIVLDESHHDLSIGFNWTKEEDELANKALDDMKDFHAKDGDEGTIICPRCLRFCSRKMSKAMERTGLSHPVPRCTAPNKLLPGCRDFGFQNVSSIPFKNTLIYSKHNQALSRATNVKFKHSLGSSNGTAA
ncbi:hypothetical protein JCM5350_006759, partial [Sporobolomyces pararoseus]